MFTISTYPKSFGSIRKGDFRLKDYSHLHDEEISIVDNRLNEFIYATASQTVPVSKYLQYPFLNAGWEWSAFRKSEKKIIKIPSGIFPEVNTETYLLNTIEAYELLSHHFSPRFIARSKFHRRNGLNLIEQEYVVGEQEFLLSSRTPLELLKNMQELLECTMKYLDSQETMPDLGFEKMQQGFRFFRNIIISRKHNCPKLFDFTVYYDPFRIYPRKTVQTMQAVQSLLQELLIWISDTISVVRYKSKH